MSLPADRPEVDLLDGRFYGRDPHPAMSWMRAHEPLYRDANGLWAVTRHEDVMTVSKNAHLFCSARGFRPDAPAAMPMMINMDRPAHMMRRNLVNRGFAPRQIAEKEGWVRGICTEIIDDVAERGECDFVRDIAARLPLIVIGELLGVARRDLDDLLRWSDYTMSGTGNPDPDAMVRAGQAFGEFSDYILRVVADRRANAPADDLMSLLVHAEIDGNRLDDPSLIFESLLILNGGDETTRHVISGGMYELMRHPDPRRRLAADPAALPRAVEEMLRWVTPIQNMMRTTTRKLTLADRILPEGERLLLMYLSANRDERIFDDPFRFDVGRDPNPHVAFGGYGPHFCLGNSLARLELRVMFEELLRRLPDLQLVEEVEPPKREANFVTGYEHMPVRFSPVRKESAAA